MLDPPNIPDTPAPMIKTAALFRLEKVAMIACDALWNNQTKQLFVLWWRWWGERFGATARLGCRRDMDNHLYFYSHDHHAQKEV